MRLLLTTLCIAGISLNAQAFDIGGLLGGDKNNDQPARVQTNSAKDALGSALGKEVDAVAGAGTADMITGKTNPMITLALKQLGIPTTYAPQVQQLYDNFLSDGSVSASEVSEQKGIMSWLNTKDTMDATTLASSLTTLFSNAQ